MRYMVAWTGSSAGNWSFDTEEAMASYIAAEKHKWRSYGRYCYTPDPSGISVVTPMD